MFGARGGTVPCHARAVRSDAASDAPPRLLRKAALRVRGTVEVSVTRRILFVTWDGPSASYLETLFLPIFHKLARHGYSFSVLQFTWARDVSRVRAACHRAGVGYHRHRVCRCHATVGSALTVATGAMRLRKLLRRLSPDFVLARSVLAALVCLLEGTSRSKLLYDSDGLALDERVDFGGWTSSSLLYRALREAESQAVREALLVLNRTDEANRVLYARSGPDLELTKFHRVLNGRDPELFRPLPLDAQRAARRHLGVPGDAPLLIHAGSLGPQYCIDLMLRLLRRVRAREPGATLLLLGGDGMGPGMRERLKKEAGVATFACEPRKVPFFISAANYGISFRKPTFSMRGVAPLKTGEYLLCGVPVLVYGSHGGGEFSEESGAALMLRDESPEEVGRAAAWLTSAPLPHSSARAAACRRLGSRLYSIDAAVGSYLSALRFVDTRAVSCS